MNEIEVKEFERGVIEDYIHDPRFVREWAPKLGLEEGHFSDESCRTAFRAMNGVETMDQVQLAYAARQAGVKDAGLNEKYVTVGVLDKIGRIQTIVDFREKEKVAAKVRQAMNEAPVYSDAASYAWNIARVARTVSHTVHGSVDETMSMADLPDPIPEEENPNALFRNGWIRRGNGFILSAQAGVGKSTLSLQVAYSWAMGCEEFGFCPIRAMKIGIIQSEDGVEEMSFFRDQVREGLRRRGWTQEQLGKAEASIFWERDAFLGKTGDEFIRTLARVQAQKRYDLIIVNPVHAYFGGDVAKNQDVSHFLREGIDPIIMDADHPCAIMLVHHTNKPGKDAAGRTIGVDGDSAYEVSGASEWTNWARAVIVISRVAKTKGFYKLTVAKRSEPLCWRTATGEKTNRKIIAHSDDIVFWREPTADELPANLLSSGQTDAGDPKQDAKELAKQVQGKVLSSTELRDAAHQMLGSKRGDRAYSELTNNMGKYGIISQRVPETNRIVYGTLLGYSESENNKASSRKGGAA
jgi:hypothetical protein